MKITDGLNFSDRKLLCFIHCLLQECSEYVERKIPVDKWLKS
jgi:hypothetical protein